MGLKTDDSLDLLFIISDYTQNSMPLDSFSGQSRDQFLRRQADILAGRANVFFRLIEERDINS
jgi:hypothetical protein